LDKTEQIGLAHTHKIVCGYGKTHKQTRVCPQSLQRGGRQSAYGQRKKGPGSTVTSNDRGTAKGSQDLDAQPKKGTGLAAHLSHTALGFVSTGGQRL